MTVELKDIGLAGDGHLLHFYSDDSELAAVVASYLAAGFRADAITIVIAAESHQREFEDELRILGMEPLDLRRDGALIALDARTMVAGLRRHGQIDADAFRRSVGTVVKQATATGRPVRAYGEMVSLLWDAGDVLAAIEVEELWNELRRELRFSLLCAYHSDSVSEFDQGALRDLHSSELNAPPLGRLRISARAFDEDSLELSADRSAPAAARRFVANALRNWGHYATLSDDALLVTSELATNAVVHAGSRFSVVVRSGKFGVQLCVRDSSSVMPTIRESGPTAASGRGLRLVDSIASHWGVDMSADGKTVWAELRPPVAAPVPHGG